MTDELIKPALQAYTVNMTVYRWRCGHCGRLNSTTESELLPDPETSEEKIGICECCSFANRLKHHTFIKPQK